MFRNKTINAISLLILLGFIWGSGYSLAKYAMTNGVPPLGYAFWQSLGPAILLSVFSMFSIQNTSCESKIEKELRISIPSSAFQAPSPHVWGEGKIKGNSLFKSKYWVYFLISGLIGITIPNTNMYFIASHIPAGELAVIVNIVPLLVYPLALLTGQEELDFWRLLALLLGVLGIVLIIGIGFSGLVSYWAALALISPLGFALCSIYIGLKKPDGINAIQSASGMLLAATIFLSPLVIYQGHFYPLTGAMTTVKMVILVEIVLSSVGYYLFFKLIQLAGPVFYSLTGGVVALTGLFWGHIIYGETPNLQQSMAVVLVISAIFLLSWRQSKQGYGT